MLFRSVMTVFGVTKAEKKGDAVSVTYKPPKTCVFMKGCDNPEDQKGCREIGRDAMPFHDIMANAPMPWFKCKTPFQAELTKVEAQTKPFCMSPDLYEDDAECWPEETAPAGGCEGFVDAGGASGKEDTSTPSTPVVSTSMAAASSARVRFSAATSSSCARNATSARSLSWKRTLPSSATLTKREPSGE